MMIAMVVFVPPKDGEQLQMYQSFPVSQLLETATSSIDLLVVLVCLIHEYEAHRSGIDREFDRGKPPRQFQCIQ
jgi:hypothetical protein